jgi:hypothetical protein
MRLAELFESDTLDINLEKGDHILAGKWKNKDCEIKSFKKDDKGQPIAVTNKGDQKILKPRVPKLSKEPNK